MLEKLFTQYDFQKADLNVFDWNKNAIKFYENVGFIINPELVNTQTSCGTKWTAINMIITKERWLENNIL